MRLLSRLSFLLLVLLASLSTASAQDNHKLIYVRNVTDQYQLTAFVYDIDEQSSTEIGTLANHINWSDVGWSPSGGYIYVLNIDEDNNRLLDLFHIETGKTERLSSDIVQRDCIAPLSWSPDDRYVMYIDQVAGENSTLGAGYLRDISSGETKLLTEAKIVVDTVPFWSPNSRYLTFFVGKEEPYLATIYDVQSQQAMIELQIPTGYYSQWSPDSRYLAFVSLNEKPITLFDTQTLEVSTYNGARLGQWSPDSRYFTYTEDRIEGETAMKMVDVERGEAIEIFTSEAYSHAHDWSWDGRYLAYAIRNNPEQAIQVLDIETGTTESFLPELSDTTIISWSPISYKFLVFDRTQAENDGDHHVTYVDYTSKETGRLDDLIVGSYFFERPLRWSSTGQIFSLLTYDGIQLVNTDTWDYRPMHDKPESSSSVRWSADGQTLSYVTLEGIYIYPIFSGTRQFIEYGDGLHFIGWQGSNEHWSIIYCGEG